MSRKTKRASNVVYQRPDFRERLLNPRRLLLWVVCLAAWLFGSALIQAFLQLGSIAVVLLTTGIGIVAAMLFTAVVKPSTHQITVSDRDLTITTRRGDHVYPWMAAQGMTVQTARFTNVHDLAVQTGPKTADDVVVRADAQTWAVLVADLSEVAETHGVSVTDK